MIEQRVRPGFLQFAVRYLIPFVVGALFLYGVTRFLSRNDEDRPPIIVSNGSVLIEAQSTMVGGAGELFPGGTTTQGRPLWVADHPNPSPKKFTATVLGSSCGTVYVTSNLIAASVSYAAGAIGRTVNFRLESAGMWPGLKDLVFDVDAAAVQQQLPSAPHQLTLDPADGRLASVTLTPKNGAPVSCEFTDEVQARVILYQKQ